MAVKLHRCPFTFLKMDGHACWRVQKALDEQGIEYEVVKEPLRRGARAEVERISAQKVLPVIEFEDGSAYREESKEMAARIRAGRLFEDRRSGPSEAGAPPAGPAI
jgi:glutathione S-transferase